MLIPASKSPMLERWFLRYTRGYLQRGLQAVHLFGEAPRFDDDGQTPLVVCMNHSSWWDVLTGFYVEHELFGWEAYTVMDARQLERYRFFRRLGVIGVDRSSIAGAKEFLRYAESLLKGRRRALWITPQGEWVSNHRRPIRFQSGLGHLASQLGSFHLARVTFHYEFWNDRLPEAFVFASAVEKIRVGSGGVDRRSFLREQEQALESQLDSLLSHVEARDSSVFRPMLRGKGGISPTYDTIRAASAKLKRESFAADHGQVITPRWRGPRRPR